MKINVLVSGYRGRMGAEAVKAIEAAPDLHLVGTHGRGENLAAAIADCHANVVVDLTEAACVLAHVRTILASGAHPVIGTSGLLPEQVSALQSLAKEKGIGGVIAPNFCLGVVLMMQYAKSAMSVFSQAEIIEMHRVGKQDAPSGTAIKTAAMMAQARDGHKAQAQTTDTAIGAGTAAQHVMPGSRGAHYQGIPIHAVRLPGMVAHQTILFANDDERLTITHDTLDRRAFMPGICLACRVAPQLDRLVYGLEHILPPAQ